MNRVLSAALLSVLSLSAAAVSVAAAPQYALIDLGATFFAGSALIWQVPQQVKAPTNYPNAGGSQCGSLFVNSIWSQYGNTAVGSTNCGGDFGEEAAKWTVSPQNTVTVTDLGVLPGSSGDVNGPFSRAYGFNTVGDIVGQSQTAYPTNHMGCPCVAVHGFIYNNGTWTDLIPIAGALYNSLAYSVNDSHEVVGYTDTISSANGETLERAFVYTNGTMYNLSFFLVGSPAVRLTNAYGIDCQGNIAVVGAPTSGTIHSYLLVRQGAPRTNCTN